MIKQGKGNIINIASIGGIQPDLSRLGYTTSKAAIIICPKILLSNMQAMVLDATW